ncbi:phage tail tape measure protein [Streptomyces sp. NPDC005885]|uniref:phage tail tape measure protein n=1 Tax=Streptomyces sp. NPDC005885 TaxID=3157079 RepID=UPI0033E0AFE7
MALTVGELNGIISIDDRTVDPALRRVENAMRQTGQRLGQDADDAGQQAGAQLGQGLVRGADGQWRNMRGQLVDAVTAAAAEAEAVAHNRGRQVGDEFGDGLTQGARQAGDDAGDAVGDGLTDSGGEGADEAVSGWTEKLSKLKAGVLLIGAAAGAALMSAFKDAMEQEKIASQLGAKLGATGPEAKKYGHVAGQLYANAVTEDFQGAADAIGAVMGAGLVDPTATNKQIESISTKVSDLATTFDQDLGGVVNAVSQMVRTGLAKNSEEALDILTKGFQSSANKGDDLLDTFNEYGTQFRKAGVSGAQAVGLMNQAIENGARDSDIAADAIKEFSIRAVDGSKTTVDGFTQLGLSADDMAKKFAKGGKTANGVLDLTLDKLRNVKDPVKQAAIATELFGTQSEDLGQALFHMDPSKAVDAVGKVGGAAGKMGDALRDNSSTRVEQFKRGLQQGLVNFLGVTVLPVLDKVKSGLGHMWDDAGKGGDEGADRVLGFFTLLGQRAKEKFEKELIPKFEEAFSSMGGRIADYIRSNPEGALKLSLIAAAIIGAMIMLPVLVAGALVTAGALMMGNFVASMINALTANLPKWWASFTGWVSAKGSEAGAWFTSLGNSVSAWFSGLWARYIAGPVSRQWNSLIATVQGLPARSVAALNSLGSSLSGAAARGWQSFKNAAVAKGTSFIGWVRGLPARTVGAIGSLGSLLTPQGRHIVEGLWVGIQGMGGWIRSKLMSWARSAIPGPIAKALGINSPSKVTKAQGRWIARGLIDGLTGSTKQVKSASTKLSDIVRDSLNPGKKRSKALAAISKGTKQLTALASREASLATRMKAATKKVADQIKARDALAADVKKGVLEGADITKQDTGGWPQTAESILAGLKSDTAAAQRFAANLATLRKKGVRSDLIAQIAQAGVEQGSSAAAALATATSGQVKQINSQQAALVTAAGKAGATAGDAMYGAGIRAAQGLVSGLKSQQKQIEAQMLRIAKGMSKSIRAALGIKSPSKVMALVGQYTAQGLIKGVEGQRGAVNSTMQSLVDTPAPGSWDSASAQARAAAVQRTVIEFRSSDRGETAYLMGKVRRGVQKTTGGDVEFAFSGRRSSS